MLQLLKKMKGILTVTLIAGITSINAYQTVNDCDALPCCSPCGSCNDWSFTAEALIFKACEDGLNFGTHTEVFTDSNDQDFIDSRVKNIHPDWHVGFRLGIGYSLPCDCWGMELNWTHFQSHANSTFSSPFNEQDVSVPGPLQFFTPAYGYTDLNTQAADAITSTKSSWKLHLDLIDLELGRSICLSECLTIRPHIGVRAAWINQSFNIQNFADAPSLSGVIQDVHLTNDYEGVGLRGGLDTQWNLGCGLSLYGEAAASVLYGNFNLKSENEFAFFVTSTEGFAVEDKDEFCACRASTDAALGLRWRGCFCNDRVAVTLQAGWEHHLFFNQNQFEDFVILGTNGGAFDTNVGDVKNPQGYHGNLCLKGVTLSAKIDF